MNKDYTDEQLEADLDATEGVRLPRETRKQILILHHREGMGGRTIAEQLGVKYNRVRSVLSEDYRNPRQGRLKPDLDDSTTEKKQTLRQQALLAEKAKKFDETATKQDCIDDLRKLQQEHPLTYFHRWTYSILGKYSEATWNRYFGTFKQFRRAAGLELNRYQHQVEIQISKHDSLDDFSDFYKAELMPHLAQDHVLYPQRGKSRDVYTLLSVSDIHDIEVDEFTLAVSIDVAKRVQPDVILFNGDVFDMYEFSRFDMDPRRVKPGERGKFVRERVFKAFREACPDSQIDFLLGNHEWRLLKHMAQKTPNLLPFLAEFCDLTIEDMFGVKEFDINLHAKWDMRAYKAQDVNSQIQKNYIVYWDCFVASHLADFGFGMSGTSGHTHKPKTDTNYSQAAGGQITWTTTGCLRSTNEDYVTGPDRHMNGFGLFHILPRTRKVIPENIIVSDFAAAAGKYYFRD